MKIFKFMRGHLGTFALVMVLLVLQAASELSLPQYMSDIVDVGVGQGGIASGVLTSVRAETLADLELLMEDGDVTLVEACYSAPDASGVRSFVAGPSQLRDGSELASALEPAEVAWLALCSRDETAVAGMRASVVEGSMTRAEVRLAADEALQAAGEASDKLLTQRAIELVRREYAALGIDLDALSSTYLVRTSASMLGFCALALVAAIANGFVSSRLGAKIGRETRHDVFSKVVRFSPAEVNRFSQASLITRCTNDVQQVQFVVVMLMRMVLLAPIMGAVAIARVLAGHTGLEWTIVAAVLVMLGVMTLLFVLVMPKFRLMQTLVDKVNQMSREMLEGIMPIRAFSREAYELERFDAASTDLMSTQLFTGRSMALLRPLIQLVLNLLTIGIVWFGAARVDAGVMQVGDIMAFISYAMQIVASFMTLAMVAILMPRASVAADRIFEVLDCPLSITDPETPVTPAVDAPRGLLAFDHVSFRYPDAEGDAVHDVSFEVGPGETLGIVGSTGSGKSSLVQLIPRLYDVTGGSVTLDGVDVREMALSDLRSRVGYVPQKARLFSGTVKSNVTFGAGDAGAEDVRRALDLAQASEFVDEMPDGTESSISQGGSNVSGGQRQRLAIARAMATKPEVLVLDDSFSALDYATDAKLRRAIASELPETAVVVVAQRVATVMRASRIIVLEDGSVVGDGTHEELLRTCGEYREIATSQLSPEELGLSDAEVVEFVPRDAPERGGDA